jgi:hypothetical protein
MDPLFYFTDGGNVEGMRLCQGIIKVVSLQCLGRNA